MSKHSKALKLALEALEIGHEYAVETAENFHIEMAGYKQQRHDAMDAEVKQIADAITAIREALSEQPATKAGELGAMKAEFWKQPAQQQDGETIVQTFTGLPKRKLRDLLAAGWQINGVCFQRTEENGTVRRGAATTGGMVLWWNQPAQQQEPFGYFKPEPFGWTDCAETDEGAIALYDRPPASKPLTDEEIKRMAAPWFLSMYWPLCNTFARAIEAAHGIKGDA